MSLEQELRFDIHRCPLCPLAASRQCFSPTILPQADTVMVLEHPSQVVCSTNNPWKQSGAKFLSQGILHASGGDLSRYHLTFAMKCHARIEGATPPLRQRLEWGRTCISEYMDRELKGVLPRNLILFGEAVMRIFFPDVEGTWEEWEGKERLLTSHGINAHFLESPTRVQREGLSSELGREWVLGLHGILGGEYSPPEDSEKTNLFEFF